MLRFRHGTTTRPRVILFGTVVLFLAVQLLLGVLVTRVHPEVRDPEFGSLLLALEARRAEWPGRPLVVIVGSSRCANAFRPSPPRRGVNALSDPVVFNFGTLYTGPLRQLQMLHRLLARGVRPDWVLAEFWANFFTPGAIEAEEKYILTRDLQLPDRTLAARYFAEAEPAYARLAEAVAVPAYHHRVQLLKCYSPFMDRFMPRLPGDWSDPKLRTVEGFGWLPCPETKPDPEQFREYTARSLKLLRDTRFADFRISPKGDAALRDLLDSCRHHGIRAALVVLPEHTMLRDNYPPGIQAKIQAYVASVVRDEQVAVIDTREWAPDDEFIDLVHVLPPAAAPYTERFGREVLRPLLAGSPLPQHLLFGTSPSAAPSPPLGASPTRPANGMRPGA